MITTTVFPGRYVQGHQAFNRLGGELARFGKRGLAVLAPSAHQNLLDDLQGQSAAVHLEWELFCESVGLPTTLADIGLSAASRDDLRKVADRACVDGEFIHNEPVDVSPDSVIHAMLAADGEGRRRKG